MRQRGGSDFVRVGVSRWDIAPDCPHSGQCGVYRSSTLEVVVLYEELGDATSREIYEILTLRNHEIYIAFFLNGHLFEISGSGKNLIGNFQENEFFVEKLRHAIMRADHDANPTNGEEEIRS